MNKNYEALRKVLHISLENVYWPTMSDLNIFKNVFQTGKTPESTVDSPQALPTTDETVGKSVLESASRNTLRSVPECLDLRVHKAADYNTDKTDNFSTNRGPHARPYYTIRVGNNKGRNKHTPVRKMHRCYRGRSKRSFTSSSSTSSEDISTIPWSKRKITVYNCNLSNLLAGIFAASSTPLKGSARVKPVLPTKHSSCEKHSSSEKQSLREAHPSCAKYLSGAKGSLCEKYSCTTTYSSYTCSVTYCSSSRHSCVKNSPHGKYSSCTKPSVCAKHMCTKRYSSCVKHSCNARYSSCAKHSSCSCSSRHYSCAKLSSCVKYSHNPRYFSCAKYSPCAKYSCSPRYFPCAKHSSCTRHCSCARYCSCARHSLNARYCSCMRHSLCAKHSRSAKHYSDATHYSNAKHSSNIQHSSGEKYSTIVKRSIKNSSRVQYSTINPSRVQNSTKNLSRATYSVINAPVAEHSTMNAPVAEQSTNAKTNEPASRDFLSRPNPTIKPVENIRRMSFEDIFLMIIFGYHLCFPVIFALYILYKIL